MNITHSGGLDEETSVMVTTISGPEPLGLLPVGSLEVPGVCNAS
jgi:hypothetical protein